MYRAKILEKFLIILPILDLITSLSTRFFPLPLTLGVIVKGLFLIFILIYLLFFNYSKFKNLSRLYLFIIFFYEILYFGFKIPHLTFTKLMLEIIGQFKFLFFPICLIGFLCFFEQFKFNKKTLINILSVNIFIYIILLIIPLLTNTGFENYNYSDNLNGTIGWFYSANELSIILTLLFPFIYKLNGRINNIVFLLISLIIIFVIFAIGTKILFMGIIIVTLLMFIISFVKFIRKKQTSKIINAFILFVTTIIIMINSTVISNFALINKYPQNEIQTELEIIIKEEQKDLNNFLKENKIYNIYNKYGRTLLGDRDLYLDNILYTYIKQYSPKTFLTGLGLINNNQYTNLIEIDTFDLYFYYGFLALFIDLLPIVYIMYLFFKSKKTSYMFLNILMIFLGYAIAGICGHVLMAPAVNIYLIMYFCLFFQECNLYNEKKIKEKELAIYALHLNYGGVERNITNLANILSEYYNVTIYSVYHLKEPAFSLNQNVKIQYLTEGIAPNKKEFLTNLKQFRPLKLFISSLTALKVLYLKNSRLNKSLSECDAKIIISTRIDFSKKMVRYNFYRNIKIAHEHIYHNNDNNYFKDLEQILKHIDYLMPSSAYLTEYYQNLFSKYKNKIIQNKMPINLHIKENNLTAKNIISVGRLSPEKGFIDLIKVFKKISEKHNDWTLTIAGDGPEREKIEELIIQYNLKKKVKLLGNLKPQELDKIYQNSSIYIMTSYEESFGLVLLEAAHYNLPLVAFSTALGAKEIINKNGLLIDNRDIQEMSYKVNKIIEDESYRKKLGEKSLLIAQKYNYSKVKTEILEFYISLEKKNIYSNLYKGTLTDFHEIINKKLENQEKTFIITANPESYIISKKDNEIFEILNNKENLVVPDGISIVKTANYLGYNIKERITGVELTEYLLRLANEKHYSLFLFGSSKSVITKLNDFILNKYPNINILGFENGYVKDKDKVMKKIKNLSPDIILIALGIPLQEKLINKHISNFNKGLFIGIGGSFDVLSGEKKRAPKIFIKLNLEWLYRILKEPKRIIRFIKYNLKFLLDINKEKN